MRRRKDGGEIDISLTVSPVRDKAGIVIGASKIARDITERKRAEAEREELLRRESAARAEAEKADRLKEEFLATVSHELRSPLNAILGWAGMLNEKRLDEEKSARAFEVIYRNAHAQNQLISDLLDVSRIITGKLRLDLSMVELIPSINAAMFDWASIGATVLNRDGDGVTAVEWNGQIFTRRSPSNKFAEAVWFSRHLGQDSDGCDLKHRMAVTANGCFQNSTAIGCFLAL